LMDLDLKSISVSYCSAPAPMTLEEMMAAEGLPASPTRFFAFSDAPGTRLACCFVSR
jgi:hypothetical protein